ncbi:hypothetical protein FB451DRAFT_1412313 [Mycena latifolia]|nr:hypothetical protein FB451DRAFT_1412313 [Mycena latifolia]
MCAPSSHLPPPPLPSAPSLLPGHRRKDCHAFIAKLAAAKAAEAAKAQPVTA